MKQISLFSTVSLLCLLAASSACTQLFQGSLFNFKQIQSSTYNTQPFQGGNIYWNVCSTLSQQTCDQNTYATFYQNQNNCLALTNYSAPSYSYVDSDDHSSGLFIKYSNGQTQNQVTSSFTIKLLCDTSTDTFTTTTPSPPQNGNYLLIINSPAGCPTMDLSSLWNFMNNNKWISVAIMEILGIFLCFFGLRFIKATLTITGFLLGFFISFVIWEALLPNGSSTGLNWTALITSLGVGVVGAIVAFKIKRAGIFALGGIAGTFLGMIIFNTFHFGSQEKYILWIEIAICSFIVGCLCVCIEDYILILASSLTGAYLMVRAISLYAGGFPNEFNVSQDMQNGNYSFPWYYYLYLSGIVVLKIAGGIYQYRVKKGIKKTKKKSSSTTSDDYYHRI